MDPQSTVFTAELPDCIPRSSQKVPEKMPKSEFRQKNSLNFSYLTENSPKDLKFGGKVAQNCGYFWRKISTSGHSDSSIRVAKSQQVLSTQCGIDSNLMRR